MNMFLRAEIVLFFAEKSLPELRAGEPAMFLETPNSVELFEEPTGFLHVHYVDNNSTCSPHTWSKAAYGLKSWFQFVQAIGRDWHDAVERDRTDYRDAYLSSISPKTGQAYGTAGVRDAMVVVRQFYHYCAHRGLYHGDIGQDLAENEQSSSLDSASPFYRGPSDFINRDRALPPIRPSEKVHPLTTPDLKLLLAEVGPQASMRENDQRFVRDRLICDLGWAVGLRLNEINTLKTLQFLSLNPSPNAPFQAMPLTIQGAKGGKVRRVLIPAWLVMDAIAFIDGERNLSLRERLSTGRSPETQLILGHPGSREAGCPISNGALQKMFRVACLSAKIVEIVEKTDPGTGIAFEYVKPKHSIHDLRHTYAVLTYHAERANGNPEPWKKIQAQLGHSSLQVTINTYLAHVEIFNEKPGFLDVRELLGL
jgi:integrase